MNSSYVTALETKARWKKWIERHGYDTTSDMIPNQARSVVSAYERVLNSRDTHFMNAKFCDLVDHARASVPDDLKFEQHWTHDRSGWMWLEKPFLCPTFLLNSDLVEAARKRRSNPETKIEIRISAVGWLPMGSIKELPDGRRFGAYEGGESVGGTAFLLFHELSDGFGMWSYFTLGEGDQVLERIQNFESTASKDGGNYPRNRGRRYVT
jgi:hypothetical protein